MQTVDRNALPKLTTDLEQARRDLTEWGYCLLANAISEDLRKRLLDRLTEQADLEGEQGVAYMADGHTQMRSIGAFDRTAKPAWQQVTGLLTKGAVRRTYDEREPACASAHAFEGNSFDLCSIRGLIQRKGAADGAMHIDQILVPFLTPLPVLCNLTVTLTGTPSPTAPRA